MVDALGGEPGVRSARFLGEDVSYADRFAEIFRRLSARADLPRSARFVCALAVARGTEILFETTGTIEGVIAAEPRGGFRSSEALCPPDATGGVLNYVHDDAPVLLLQTITDWSDRGTLEATELMQLGGVEFADGQLTLFFYAGFYS